MIRCRMQVLLVLGCLKLIRVILFLLVGSVGIAGIEDRERLGEFGRAREWRGTCCFFPGCFICM